MPEVAFVSSRGQAGSLHELASTLAYELERQAVDCTQHLGGFPAVQPDRVYVLMDPASYLAAEGEQAIPGDAALRRTVLLWVAAPPSRDAASELSLLDRAGAVFVLDQRAVVAMHRLGVPARLLRPGYSPALDRFDPEAPRPIDVLFLGARTPRRARSLAQAARVLARYECALDLADGDDPPEAERRWELLAQAKVLINLHRDGETRLEWRDVLDAVHAGAAVVTEHASGIAPLEVGEHLLVAGADSLPYVAEMLVRDDARRDRLRTQAYERLRTWIPFALPVSVLRAAIVELVGEPAPPNPFLGSAGRADAGR